MKKTLFLGIVLLLVSCDQDYCSDYRVSNKIDTPIEIRFFSNSSSNNHTIEAQNHKILSEGCSLGGFSILKLHDNDSIQLLSNNEVVKTYYPLDEFEEVKSIYKTEDVESWSLVKNDKFYRIYEFVITNEDLD